MLYAEAQWFAARFNEYDSHEISPLVNIGSGSRSFRDVGQPFISNLLFNPLKMRGVTIWHVDLECDEGVDIAGDIFDRKVIEEIKSLKPECIFLANLLEHVENPLRLAKLCVELVETGGVIAVSVPYDFPYHLAPIDTLFRPTLDELAALFPQCSVMDSEIVVAETFGEQLVKSPGNAIKHIVRMFAPWPTTEHRRAAMERNNWLFRNYRISCIILEKQDDG